MDRRGLLLVVLEISFLCGAVVSVACPKGSTLQCKAPTGVCDKGWFCPGVQAQLTCPSPSGTQWKPNTTVCRASTSSCDPAEWCTGSSADCPADINKCGVNPTLATPKPGQPTAVPPKTTAIPAQPSATPGQPSATPASIAPSAICAAGSSNICRQPAGPCDNGGVCSGYSVLCPPSTMKANGTVCRASSGGCDPAEVCNGVVSACPVDIKFLAAGVVCRPSAGQCDVPEVCSGTSAVCPKDSLSPAGKVCRPSSGMCDPADVCSGKSAVCFNTLLPNTTVCRASTDVCDAAEFCTGTSGACPPDAMYSRTTVCRASRDLCDAPELCKGNDKACPPDRFFTNGRVCRISAGSCDIPEVCSGSSAQCPSDQVLPSGTVCRASTGTCDAEERCTGSSGICPADLMMPSSTICRGSTGPCDAPEFCTGSNSSCPADMFISNGTVCRPATDVCDAAELCSGASVTCPVDVIASNGTVCRSPSQMCDPVEVCNGVAVSCPPDVNPPCPWAWFNATYAPLVYEGEYCGVLNDKSKIVINITGKFVDMFVVAPSSAATIRSTMILDSSFAEPVLSPGSVPVKQNWAFPQNAASPTGVKILSSSNTSLVINFEWLRSPYITASQTVTLSPSCGSWSLPAGKYCGGQNNSDQFPTAVLVVYPRASPSLDQEAMLYITFSVFAAPPVMTAISLTFVWLGNGGDVVFTSRNSADDLDGTVYKITYSDANGIQIYFDTGSLPMTFQQSCSPSRGYMCQQVPSQVDSYMYNLCLEPSQDYSSVQIDLIGARTLCDNVTAELTYPLYSLPWPLHSCLQGIGIFSIAYDFFGKGFSATVSSSVPRTTTRPACRNSSPPFCGNVGDYAFMARYRQNVVQTSSAKAGYKATHWSPSLGVSCNSPNDTTYSLPSISGASQLAVVSGMFYAVAVEGGSTTPLTRSNCYIPSSSGITRFGGSATISGTTYYASVLVGGLATVLTVDGFYDLTFKVSTSGNLKCSAHGQGMLVPGGDIILANLLFGNTLSGTCEGSTSSVAFYGSMDAAGSVVTLRLLGPYISLSISAALTADVVPSGRYCTNVKDRNFVMIQANADGTTTIFASINKTQTSITLWVDVFGANKTVVNRTSGAFPVQLLLFGAEGYTFSVDGGSTKQPLATTANCVAGGFGTGTGTAKPPPSVFDGVGQFCGVHVSTGSPVNSSWYASNTSFAKLSVVVNPSTSSLSTSLTASRRVSSAQPLNIVFNDHPRLLPFYFPKVTALDYNGTTFAWTVTFTDDMGSTSVDLIPDTCGNAASQLTSNMYGGLANDLSSQSDSLHVIATVTSRNVAMGLLRLPSPSSTPRPTLRVLVSTSHLLS